MDPDREGSLGCCGSPKEGHLTQPPVAGPGGCPEEGRTPPRLGQTRRKTPDSNSSDITVAYFGRETSDMMKWDGIGELLFPLPLMSDSVAQGKTIVFELSPVRAQKRRISLISKPKAGPISPLLKHSKSSSSLPNLEAHLRAVACLIPSCWHCLTSLKCAESGPSSGPLHLLFLSLRGLSICHSSAVVLNLGSTLEILGEP